jgi:serine/threonine protein kinase
VYFPVWQNSTLSTEYGLPEFKQSEISVDEYAKLGGSGFTSVFRGKWRIINRDVAVKFLVKPLDKKQFRDFRKYAALSATLNHENIVRIYGCVQLSEEGLLGLVMEYADEGTLRLKLEAGDVLSKPQKRNICLELIAGVRYLHNIDVIHKNIKPDNVLLFSSITGDQVTAKLTDIGLPTPELTDATLVRHPLYIAPEIFEMRSSKFTIETDIYGVLMTLFETFKGKGNFVSLGHTTFTFPGDFPVTLRKIVENGLVATNPEDRPNLELLQFELITVL